MSELPAKYTDDRHAQQLINRLFHVGEDLPDELRDELLEANEAVGRALIELAADRQLADRRSPGGGWVPVHAVRLLGERRQPDAVDTLIDIINHADVEDVIYSSAVFALQNIGKPALEPTLEAIDAGFGPGSGTGLAEVLCELDVHDDRILHVLLDVFDDDVQLGASYLASYGDPAALDVLHDAFDASEVDTKNPFANHIFTELAAAIEELGGELTTIEQAKLNRANRIRRRAADAILGAPASSADDEPDTEQPDPDEPCWCGSGTKFKNCHGRPDHRPSR